MAIVDKIHDLTKKMTGQDGVGSDITTAINDLTAKWTQSAGKGSNIEESIANLSSNASSGGDLSVATITIVSEGEIGVSVAALYPYMTTWNFPTSINVMTEDGHSWFPQNFADGEQITVNAGNTKSLSYIILPQGGVTIMEAENLKPTVEGNATVKTLTIEGSDHWVAEATGDCTITFPAHR